MSHENVVLNSVLLLFEINGTSQPFVQEPPDVPVVVEVVREISSDRVVDVLVVLVHGTRENLEEISFVLEVFNRRSFHCPRVGCRPMCPQQDFTAAAVIGADEAAYRSSTALISIFLFFYFSQRL